MTTPENTPVTRFRRTPMLIIAALAIVLATGCSSTNKNTSSNSDAAGDSMADDGDLSIESDTADAGKDAAAAQEPTDGPTDELAAEELGADSSKKTADKAPSKSASESLEIPSNPEPPAADVAAKTASEAPAAPAADTGGNFALVSVTDIKYVSKKGGGTVVVETSEPATYHTREVPAQNQAIIEISNAQLPDRLKRPYITKDFGQAISSINAYQEKGSSTVRVVVQFKGAMHPDVKQEGRALMLSAAESMGDVEDNPTLGDNSEETGGKAAIDVDENGTSASQGSSQRTARKGPDDARILPTSSLEETGDKQQFYGRPISIEVRDTPVRDVINLIAEQSGANIVLAGDVDGTVSLKLRQIPWDQALLIVMKTRNLGYVRQGTILRVAPYDSLQKESEAARRVVDAQKAAEPLRVKIIPVGYAKVADLEVKVGAFLSKDRGRVVADPRTNSLIVTDTPDVLERVANLIKALDLPPLQVLIEGKVVEAREQFGRDFGINWGWTGQSYDVGAKQITQNLSMNMPIPNTGGVYNFRVGQFDLFGDLTATLGLAEANDLVHVVSSPRIVAVNNEAATITQATNIPVQTTTTTGGAIVTAVNYTPIEMKLEVTPQVTSENDVIMQINIRREFAGNRIGGNPPDINKREAKTKVLVRNGSTAVVGGVYQSDSDETENGIPWLKSIPVLGWLFKNRSVHNDKTELLVFLTPRILNAETSLQKENTL